MRFLAILKANEKSEAGVRPTEEMLERMERFNDELVKGGAMLDVEGLQPSAQGARITFSEGEQTVTDGPFEQQAELVAGFWMIHAKSKQEAIDWFLRCPFNNGEEIEIRQVFERRTSVRLPLQT